MLLDHRGPRGAAANGFEAQRAGAGKEIEGVLSSNVRSQQIKNGLAEAVFHRPGAKVAGVVEAAAAKVSADDAHAGDGPNIAAREPAAGR